MRWHSFVVALCGALVLAQGVAAWFDGYLTQAQLRSRGITDASSLLEHGGVWADALLLVPLLAYLTSKYKPQYAGPKGVAVFIAVSVAVVIAGRSYQRAGFEMPEAHAHDGQTTAAGILHAVFAILAMWTLGLLYLRDSQPILNNHDLILTSTVLTSLFFLGVVKFNDRWLFTPAAKWQVAVEVILLWAYTFFVLLRSKSTGVQS